MAVQVSFPGVYVQEVASGVRTIAGVATSVAAFVGMTSRGRMDEPTRVLSYTEYARVFGEETTAGEMTHQVLQFFLNGGQTAWITRIAQGAVASAVTLNSDVEPVLTLRARDPGKPGDTIKAEVSYDTPTPELTFNLRIYRETIDGAGRVTISDLETIPDLSMNPNSPRFVETIVAGASSLVTATSIATAPAANEGFSFSGLILPTDPDDAADALRLRWTATANAFRLSVGGQRFIDVTLPAPPVGDITVLLPVIENAITTRLTAEGLSGPVTVVTEDIGAGPDGQVVVVRSTTNGPVEIRTAAQQDVAAALQLGVGQGGVESDRFARARPAPTGYFSRIHSSTALNGGQDLGRLGNFAAAAQNSLTTWSITDAASAAPRTGPVTFFRPAAAPATSPMFVGTAYVPAAGDPALGSLQNARQNLGALAAAIMAGAPDAWDAALAGYRLILTPKFGSVNADATATLTTAGGFNLSVAAEMFGNTGVGALTPSNVRAYSLGVAGAGTFQGTPIAGSNGTLPAIAQYRNAFGEIERKTDIFNLMILPRARDDTNTQTDADRKVLWGEASAFCQRRRAFLIVDPPSDGGDWDSVNEVAAPGTGIEGSRTGVTIDHAAIYWPRLSVADPVTRTDIIIDPAGTIAGLYASIDARRGVWKAPAGLEATLRGMRGVQHRIGDRENGVINPMAVNAIRMLPTGVVVWGARTMAGFDNSGFDDWRYIPVRRLALNIEESLYRGLQFAVFEPNDEPLWAQIRLAAGAFMNTLFRQGAFKGERKSDAYFVKCDEETTTQNDINLGIVNVVVGFAPLKPAEFVIITIRQMAGQIEV